MARGACVGSLGVVFPLSHLIQGLFRGSVAPRRLFEDLKFRYILQLKQREDRPGFISNVKETDKGGFYSMLEFILAQPPMAPLWLPKAFCSYFKA